ncbi:MAG TPA: hypothetical protein VIN71_02890, partial [Pseudomonadales bacterium]
MAYLCALQPATASSAEKYTPNDLQLVIRLANAGRAGAQYTLARMYMSGRGVDRNDQLALHWLQKAAAQNHGPSQNQLGLLYLSGTGVNMDCQTAEHWFSSVNEKSDIFPQAQSNLAWVLATCPQESARDGQRALSIMQQLLADNRRDNPNLLDTLAAAFAETGQFQQAIATQQRAIALLQRQPSSPHQKARFTAR